MSKPNVIKFAVILAGAFVYTSLVHHHKHIDLWEYAQTLGEFTCSSDKGGFLGF